MLPEQIYKLILENPLEALKLITELLSSGNLTREQFKKYSEKFRKYQKLKKFGCTPSEETAKQLIRIESTPKFKKLKSLVGKHDSLRLARIGLYLESLNAEGRTKLSSQIRDEIAQTHPQVGLQFLTIGSSGLMSGIIDSLENLKTEFGLGQNELVIKYEHLVARIDYLTVTVNNSDGLPNINLKISKKIEQNPEQFFIVASGMASDSAAYVIAQMQLKNTFRTKGYLVFQPTIIDFGDSGRKQYIWTIVKFV